MAERKRKEPADGFSSEDEPEQKRARTSWWSEIQTTELIDFTKPKQGRELWLSSNQGGDFFFNTEFALDDKLDWLPDLVDKELKDHPPGSQRIDLNLSSASVQFMLNWLVRPSPHRENWLKKQSAINLVELGKVHKIYPSPGLLAEVFKALSAAIDLSPHSWTLEFYAENKESFAPVARSWMLGNDDPPAGIPDAFWQACLEIVALAPAAAAPPSRTLRRVYAHYGGSTVQIRQFCAQIVAAKQDPLEAQAIAEAIWDNKRTGAIPTIAATLAAKYLHS